MNANNTTNGNGYTHKGTALAADDETSGKLVLQNPQDLYGRNF